MGILIGILKGKLNAFCIGILHEVSKRGFCKGILHGDFKWYFERVFSWGIKMGFYGDFVWVF